VQPRGRLLLAEGKQAPRPAIGEYQNGGAVTAKSCFVVAQVS
jgi:hypothetical protein